MQEEEGIEDGFLFQQPHWNEKAAMLSTEDLSQTLSGWLFFFLLPQGGWGVRSGWQRPQAAYRQPSTPVAHWSITVQVLDFKPRSIDLNKAVGRTSCLLTFYSQLEEKKTNSAACVVKRIGLVTWFHQTRQICSYIGVSHLINLIPSTHKAGIINTNGDICDFRFSS